MLKYDKLIADVMHLQITDSNMATVTDKTDPDETVQESVQLENDAEAQLLIAEMEDPEGELMHTEGSICGKYKQLHQFRP